MIGISDLETEAGNAEFGDYCRAVKRFIKSRIFSSNDVEELAQETITRVLQKISDDKSHRVNAGYFINTAKIVLLENTRKYAIQQKRFVSATIDEEIEIEKPLDAEAQLKKYAGERERAIYNDCFLECFEERSLDEQVLLWRYSFDEKFKLETEEPESYKNFLGTILDSIREIREKFIPLQTDAAPVTDDVRVKISRLRKKLKACLTNCAARKKGFG